MPYSADAIANFFLTRAKEEGIPITHLKLQKLIFFAHAWHIALDELGRPLIDEPVEAWKYGPVIASIYREFSRYGGNEIEELAQDRNENSQLMARYADVRQCIGELTTMVRNATKSDWLSFLLNVAGTIAFAVSQGGPLVIPICQEITRVVFWLGVACVVLSGITTYFLRQSQLPHVPPNAGSDSLLH